MVYGLWFMVYLNLGLHTFYGLSGGAGYRVQRAEDSGQSAGGGEGGQEGQT
jgi:hypothetical protein